MSLVPPLKVGKLRETLHAKAKGSPDYCFYALYDKVYRADVIDHAYRLCQTNGGAAGVDGQTFGDIEQYGQKRWLDELAEELRTKRYRPEAVRRVHIPKPGQPGRTRPLGIPRIKDRVVMTAAMWVLEAIFEADLQPETIRLPPEAKCTGRGSPRPRASEVAALGGNRRRFVRLLRHDPAFRVNEVGGTPHQRSALVAIDQDVASSPGGRDR